MLIITTPAEIIILAGVVFESYEIIMFIFTIMFPLNASGNDTC